VKQVISALRKAIIEDGPIVLGVGAVWLAMLIVLASKGVSGLRPSAYLGNLLLYVITLSVMAVFVLAGLLYRHRPKSPIGFLLGLLASSNWLAQVARGIPMLLAVAVLMPAFSAMKSSIPLFNSFSWDPVWVSADRMVHGTDPWRLLQPVFGFPIVTSLLSVAYHAWLFIVYAGSAYFCIFPKDRELRAQYFISYFACWTIIGVAMAIGFASVGPCFLAPLTGDHRFDEQMAYLYHANERYPVFVLGVRVGAPRLSLCNGWICRSDSRSGPWRRRDRRGHEACDNLPLGDSSGRQPSSIQGRHPRSASCIRARPLAVGPASSISRAAGQPSSRAS
jgi:hypothetical protein